jgi:DNA gyrase subunit A
MQSNLWATNDIVDEQSRNSLEYGMAVNTDRALPNAADGFKPVAKRSVYDMWETGTLSSKPHRKSARIVGDTMGKYHPHGDSSIYGAIVRLAQPWVMRYPIFDGHGNFGNIGGDGPAAMRYTEIRLTKLAEEGLLAGIKKKNVDFIPNYDETEDEPVVLPAVFPNLLCNPNEGIGWAMGCSWAPHNLGEVAEAIYTYMDGGEPMLPGPDFPTGGIVINKNDIPNIMRTGHGSVKIRGKYEVKGQEIIFTEVPYGTRIENLMAQIGKGCDSGDITNVVDIRNEGDKKGVRLVIEVDKNTNPELIVKKLFAKTDLQSSFSYNQLALVDKTPTELNLKDCCKVYVDHNVSCIIKEAKHDLDKAQDRLHIVEGLLKALEDIDNIIALIKKSASAAAAKESLMAQYKFTEPQAKAILAMRLSSLANLEKVELQNEQAELVNNIAHFKALISDETVQKNELRSRLGEIVKKFGDARRTELAQIEVSKEDKEIAYVEPEKCVVVMTKAGLVKRIPTASFRTQKRNGKGVKTQDDIIATTIRTNTVDSLMVFTNQGRLYRILVDNIPVGTNVSKGTSLHQLLEMQPNEEPSVIYSIYRDTDAQYVLFVTKNGLVKKTSLDEYIKTKKKTGIAAISLKDGDELASVSLVKDEDIILLTSGGMGIRFNSSEVAPTSRATSGVKGMTLKADDYVVAAMPVRHVEDQVAVFVQSGLGKKFSMSELPVQKRAGKGLICYKPTDVTGKVTAGALISDEDSLLLLGDKSSICIAATEVPNLSRGSIGNQLIKNGKIYSVSKV